MVPPRDRSPSPDPANLPGDYADRVGDPDPAANSVVATAEHSSSVSEVGPELFRRLVLSVRDYAIFALDATGHVITWNEGAQRIKGYAPNEIIGKHFSTFYPPERIAEGFP